MENKNSQIWLENVIVENTEGVSATQYLSMFHVPVLG